MRGNFSHWGAKKDFDYKPRCRDISKVHFFFYLDLVQRRLEAGN